MSSQTTPQGGFRTEITTRKLLKIAFMNNNHDSGNPGWIVGEVRVHGPAERQLKISDFSHLGI